MVAQGLFCSETSYIVQVPVTKKSSTAGDDRPKAFPSPLLSPRDTAVAFAIFDANRVVQAMRNFFGGSHRAFRWP